MRSGSLRDLESLQLTRFKSMLAGIMISHTYGVAQKWNCVDHTHKWSCTKIKLLNFKSIPTGVMVSHADWGCNVQDWMCMLPFPLSLICYCCIYFDNPYRQAQGTNMFRVNESKIYMPMSGRLPSGGMHIYRPRDIRDGHHNMIRWGGGRGVCAMLGGVGIIS